MSLHPGSPTMASNGSTSPESLPWESQPWRRFPAQRTQAVTPLQQRKPRQNVSLLQTGVRRKPREPHEWATGSEN